MRRRIPTAHVAVARTAPTLHRLRLGSLSASAIRPHAAARRPALTCDQDARNRDPDTRATRQWICIGGRSGCAARAHRPGWARRAIDARPSTPSPQGERGEDARPNRASSPHKHRRGGLGLWQRVRPDLPHGRPAGSCAGLYAPRLDHDALDLVDGDRVCRPFVELRRLRGGVPGDLLRVFERPPHSTDTPVIPVARNVWQQVEGGISAAAARRLIIARTRRRESARPVSRRPAGSTLWKSAALASSSPASSR